MTINFDHQRDRISTSSGVLTLNTTGAFTIPVGNTEQRPSVLSTGQIRFNSQQQTFEGYTGTSWSSLGGVRDVDGNTYIIAETAPGVNNNEIDFYTDGVQRMQIGTSGNITIGNTLTEFTINGSNGNTAIAGDLDVNGQATLASANVEDLTDNRIVIVGANGELEDDTNFRFDGNDFMIGTVGNETFTVNVATGNTTIAGTLDVTGNISGAQLSSSTLTNDRVVIVGTGSLLEDTADFTFNGTALNVGQGNFTVEVANGDTNVNGDLTVGEAVDIGSVNGSTSTTTGALTVVGGVGIGENVHVGGNLSVNGTLGADGGVTLGDDVLTDILTLNAKITGSLIPSSNDAHSLGSIGEAWRDLFLSESVTFEGASTENEIVIPTNLADALSITETSGDLIVFTTTSGARLITIYPNTVIEGTLTVGTSPGTIAVNEILDEDDFISNSDTALATQQSIKAYVDNSVSDVDLNDLNFAGTAGTGTVNLLTQTFTITGTTNEIETTSLDQTLTIGLPDNVTITNNLNIGGNTVITGNLTVNGSTTTVSTTELVVEDNIITLNDGEAGAGVTAGSAGIEIDRGSESTVSFVWDESTDRWTAGTEDIEAGEFFGIIDGGTF